MGKLIIGLVLGLLAGGAITYFTFVGVPDSSHSPGEPIKAPEPGSTNASAHIVLGEDLFNQVLTTIFRDISEPAFPIAENRLQSDGPRYEQAAFQQARECDGRIRILQEGSGVRSGVQLAQGRISAPMAFAGSYNSAFGCLRFNGWAQTNLELRFDKGQQAVYGRLNVETVNLDGVNPLLSGIITPIVQSTINTRVNPIQIIQGQQLAVDMPIDSTGGKLKATVEDVRAEIIENALNLYVTYTFSGTPAM
jgi:hypothetical protein